MDKKPFVTLEQLREIERTYPTPFYLYDEKGIRENAARLKQAFSWNRGYKEYFAGQGHAQSFPVKYTERHGMRHGLFIHDRAYDVQGMRFFRF